MKPCASVTHRKYQRSTSPLVAWTSASPYTDRTGMVFDNTDRVLKRWLAWHWVLGVRYFLVFESGATWDDDPHHSKMWPAIKPFVESERRLVRSRGHGRLRKDPT